jgi:hypothetical protein
VKTRRRWIVAAFAAGCALMAVAGCALKPTHSDSFSFAVMGDVPYNESEERLMLGMIEDLNREALAFVVHVGDIKAGGNSPCTDELFEKRRAQFDASAHPFLLLPGDNDWTDCRRPSNGSMNPLERLSKMREVLYPQEQTLGKRRAVVRELRACVRKVGLVCECPGYPENRFWTDARGVTFATLNVQGSNNNLGFDEASNRELRCRNIANQMVLEQALRQAIEQNSAGLVIMLHANPLVESKNNAYGEFLEDLRGAAAKLSKPVLVIHGDTHHFRIDKPFMDAAGKSLSNVVRLETYGSPNVGWVKVTVDRNDPQLFRIESGAKYQ